MSTRRRCGNQGPGSTADNQTGSTFRASYVEPGFADLFLFTEKIRAGATLTTVSDPKDPTEGKEPVTFTATVTARAVTKEAPTGAIQFMIDGKEVGNPVPLDQNGEATWNASDLPVGEHQVRASYIATKGSVFLNSSSFDETHTVDK